MVQQTIEQITPLKQITPTPINQANPNRMMSVINFKITMVAVDVLRLSYHYHGRDLEITYTFSEQQEQVMISELIPNCLEGLCLLRDGSIVINCCHPSVDLALSSCGNIVNNCDINATRIRLEAKRLLLQGNITTKRGCTLIYKDKLDNYGKLVVGTMLDCKGSWLAELDNYGAIKVTGKACFNYLKNHPTGTVYNHGLMYAEQNLEFNVRGLGNDGSIISNAQVTGFIKKMVNNGTIVGATKINMVFKKYLFNSIDGVIASNQEINFNRQDTTSDLNEAITNKGLIFAVTEIRIGNPYALIGNHETGEIQSKNVNIFGGILYNNGKIAVDEKLSITLGDADVNLYNQTKGAIIAKRLIFHSTRMANLGAIHAQQEIGGIVGTLDNQEQGKITSDVNINLMVLEKINNECLIQAGEGLLLDTKSITIGNSGQLIANKLKTFSQNFSSSGELISGQNCDISASNLDNLPGGKIICAQELALRVEQKLDNHGLLQANIAKFMGKSANNSQTGVFEVGQLQLKASIGIGNAGLISATQEAGLFAGGDLVQTANARIDANAATLSATNLQLAGEIGAKTTVELQASEILVKQDSVIGGVEQVKVTANNLTNQGTIASQQELQLHAYNRFEQTSGAQVIAPDVFVKALKLENAGKILAGKKVDLNTIILSNLYQAIIASASQIRITAADLDNAGTIHGNQELRLTLTNCLDNLASGELVSLQNLLVEVGYKLKNAGLINSEAKALIKVSEALENCATGIIKAKEFDLTAGWSISNWGQLFCHDQLALNVSGIINNYQSGKILSEQTIDLISHSLANHGEIGSNAKLRVFIENTLNNYQTAKISSTQALNLIGAKLIVNAGEIISSDDILLESFEVLENLKTGVISAEHSLTSLSQMIVSNNGRLIANQLKLQASLLLLDGEIATEELITKSQQLTTSGEIISQKIDLAADLVQLDGKINADSLMVEAKNYLQLLAHGEINCNYAVKLITAAGFVNLGKILSNNKLAIIAKELFHDVGAELNAGHELYLQAVNLYLDGNLTASGNLFIVAANEFKYKTATLKANGELHLKLANGSSIVHDIRTPGSLRIEFLAEDGSWYNEQQLQAGKDITIDIPGFVFVNGRTSTDALLHAQETLRIRAKSIEVAQGSLLANKVDLDSSYNITIKADGTIAGIEGNLHAGDTIEQHGRIEFLKNLSLMAKKAYSHRDSTTLVGGDLEVEVDQWILDGLTKVDGDLNAKTIDFHLSQYANTLQVPVVYNGSVGRIMVGIQQADPHTGLLQAKNINLSCETFTQMGGVIKSDGGNTYIEIKGDAFLEGLRTTHTWQGAISALGRNYAIVPVFVPATIESTGDLTVNSQGKLVGATVELKAVGVKEVVAKQGVHVTEKYEHYDPPEYRQRKKKGFFRGLLSIAVSAFASCFIGPAACSLMGITGTAAVTLTSAAIGGAVGAAFNGGKLVDIFKGAAIGAITAGFMDKLRIKLPEAITKGKNLAENTIKNAIRANTAANSMLKYGLQTGVAATVNGRAKLDVLSLISSGFAGFAGATINNKIDRNLFDIAAKTGTTTLANGGNVWRNLSISTAEVVGSHFGEQMANEFTSKMDAQRKAADIKQSAGEASKTNSSSKDEASSSSSINGKQDAKKSQESTKFRQPAANKSQGSKEPSKKPLFEPLSKLKQQEIINNYGLVASANASISNANNIKNYALIAQHVYGEADIILPTGYTEITNDYKRQAELGINLNPNQQNFVKEGLYEAPNGEIILAIRGTTNFQDMGINIKNNLGKVAKDTERAVNLARKIKTGVGDKFTIVGHSKGGHDAAVVAGATQSPAYTFNAQGVHPNVAKQFKTTIAEINQHTTKYVVEGELLNALQYLHPFIRKANGVKVKLSAEQTTAYKNFYESTISANQTPLAGCLFSSDIEQSEEFTKSWMTYKYDSHKIETVVEAIKPVDEASSSSSKYKHNKP